ncbi:MAG: lipoyl synthase [Bacteroidales bacterium]|nr:lipoyl synthase [Bacteroidales bacterium]
MEKHLRKPEWLRTRIAHGNLSTNVRKTINQQELHTICESGLCPNRAECHGCGTATLMIGGNICTRACKFCNVPHGKPLPLDSQEPQRVAEAAQTLGLKHVVLTSVDRDDLHDLGAEHWAATIRAVKQQCPQVTMETLIPDFQGRIDLLDLVIAEKPEVISHNLETVERLTPAVRTKATYRTSLKVLEHIAAAGIVAKSGIMLGLGETEAEILQTMDDLLATGCSVMTIGQYLQPSLRNISVKEYVHPDKFEEYRKTGLQKGFKHVESGVFVRSSYHAEKHAG